MKMNKTITVMGVDWTGWLLRTKTHNFNTPVIGFKNRRDTSHCRVIVCSRPMWATLWLSLLFVRKWLSTRNQSSSLKTMSKKMKSKRLLMSKNNNYHKIKTLFKKQLKQRPYNRKKFYLLMIILILTKIKQRNNFKLKKSNKIINNNNNNWITAISKSSCKGPPLFFSITKLAIWMF